MTTRIGSRLAAIAAAALVGLTGAALAQPFHHGPHGGGDVVMSIVALKGQLNLNTSQQSMWDNAVAAGKAARQTARANMQKVHDTLTAELAKPEPDLAAVAAASDARAMPTRRCMTRCAMRGSTSTPRSRPTRRRS